MCVINNKLNNCKHKICKICKIKLAFSFSCTHIVNNNNKLIIIINNKTLHKLIIIINTIK